VPNRSPIKVTLLQRSEGALGKGLGKTTAWAHRMFLKQRGVDHVKNAEYVEINNDGLWIKNKQGELKLIPAQQIVTCAGQVSENTLAEALQKNGKSFAVVGGAKLAGELDAKRSIREAWEATIGI
jgi:2,4-dienoyl-CoA reductase (NADPH2)